MLRILLPLTETCHKVRIEGDKARYLAKVRRCKPGDELVIFNGKGSVFRASVASVGKNEVIAEVGERLISDTESSLHVVLVQGLLKGEKMDLVVQKTTELGIGEIFPVVTDRSQVRATGKAVRWTRIAEEASRQSNRTKVPVIRETASLRDVLLSCPTPGPSLQANPHQGLIFWEMEGAGMKEAVDTIKGLQRVMIAVGPEGGFSEEEVGIARSHGFVVTSLGRRILRAETAAIAAMAIVQYALGDLCNYAVSR
jgi:16S rRNA (uracil1498-N3)-methyltransferase